MLKELNYQNQTISSQGNESYEPIPETSPAYQFCQKISEVNSLNENGWTHIYRSIISNDLEALKDLLKFGADPNICNNLGESPLYLCIDMNNLEAFNILLNNEPKSNCNLQKRNGDTALHLSIKKNKYDFTNILLDNNADPNIPNKLYSQTPTHLAIINKVDKNILEKLKKNNADIYTIKDKYDKTAYDYALEQNDENYIYLILQIFGEKSQRNSLYNTIKDDLISNKNNKKTELINSFENHIKTAISNTNIKSLENKENKSLNGSENKDNNLTNDKQKIKDIIVSEVNKINMNELTPNNNLSSPKVNLNNILNSNLNTNSNSNNNSRNKTSSLLNNNYNKDINETNPLEMMNKIIISNSLEKEKNIDNIKKILYDKIEINDSLELQKENNYEFNNGNIKEEIKRKNDNGNKKHISYYNLKKNKEKIIPKLNFINDSNNNTINNNNSNNNTINNNINNNSEINNQSNMHSKKRKSYISNYSNNIHYEASTNPNTSRGSYFVNLQMNNNMTTIRGNEKTNYVFLTQGNDPEYNCGGMSTIPCPNKNNSNTNYKTSKKQFLYTEDDNNQNMKIKQTEENTIHNNDSFSKLRDWLISCDLLPYYNLLKNNSSFNFESIINNNIENNKNITYRDIENIGIRKPGHIFRFLIKLDIDANIIDFDTHSKIINKFNNNVLTTIGLTASNNELKCCGMTINLCNKENNKNNYSDIFHFLHYLDLMNFKENFIHNGFDQVDYIILQLFSQYKFDKIILKEFLHIYDEKDKKKVLNALYDEKKKIAKDLGIYIDENEKNNILKTEVNDDADNKGCYIF